MEKAEGCSVAEKIRAKIKDARLKDIQIFAYGITDSTNTRAREYAEGDWQGEPAVFIADGQSRGRGRRGRAFDSSLGDGLYISFLFRPEGKGLDGTALTVRAAVDVCHALSECTGLSAEIKWVNDIFVGEKKLAGILCEGQMRSEDGGLEYAVCGIGINLNKRQFPRELCDIATTVEDEVGIRPDRELLAARLTERFFRGTAEPLIEEYRRLSLVPGRSITVRRISGEVFSAVALDVTDRGGLLVMREDGTREELISAEVSVKI